MIYTVYKITNKINGKEYIGKHQTSDLNDGYMGSGKNLKRAINKHGIENFIKEVLFSFETEEEMNKKESELVTEEYCSRKDTYNICPGGHGGWGYVNATGLNKKEHSPEMIKHIKERLSQSAKNQWKSEEFRQLQKQLTKQKHIEGKMAKGYFGNRGELDRILTEKANSPESIAKKRNTYARICHMQGSKNSQYGTCWITNGKENKKIKKEELDNYISLGYNKGRVMVPSSNG